MSCRLARSFVCCFANARGDLALCSANPTWKETKFLIINSLNDVLTMGVWDYNDHRTHTELGIANFDLKSVENDPEQELVVSKILATGKEKGDLQYAINWYPVLQPKKTNDGTSEPVPDSRMCSQSTATRS